MLAVEQVRAEGHALAFGGRGSGTLAFLQGPNGVLLGPRAGPPTQLPDPASLAAAQRTQLLIDQNVNARIDAARATSDSACGGASMLSPSATRVRTVTRSSSSVDPASAARSWTRYSDERS